ncbi:cobyric acid synthase [Rhizobiales bacterium]|uniref:cobyric acid synthase n=1 Tax=Hongsoonwoonella zoysiae TaxID=2821844 RepID=UPI001560D488|nr:cobyric acid synthase [Hongsoonwoonella zoysiae]NRG19046.1 cobyric acid synthase [Hongsoonwoonella zoysiae]
MSARTPAIMIQGTGSNVGKSLIVAGLCRLFANRGLIVRPFKPQNMSNNAAVTVDGGEIGRAQALQALAARAKTSVHMNPVLLKPETDTGAQVIVQGRRAGTMKAREYGSRKAEFLPKVLESFAITGEGADLVLVEGAGSPAEINLRAGDIANMGFAQAADLPVAICGDIDRGGVIASLVGTHTVLNEAERGRIKAFFINRFRGDPSLFDEGVKEIAARTGWASLGVVPWFDAAGKLPAEDALGLEDGQGRGRVKIVVPVTSRIANFDDLDPLRMEEDVTLQLVRGGEALPGDADLVLLPGSKSTIGDLAFFRKQGWDIDLAAHVRRGGRVLGICGGYQMLGKAISDPQGIEGEAGTVAGLGLLDVETELTPEKRLVSTHGRHCTSGEAILGYEIHIGRTEGRDRARPFATIAGEGECEHADGAVSAGGRIAGTYVHGLFAADGFRKSFLGELGAGSTLSYDSVIDRTLDDLAAHLEACFDTDALLDVARDRVRKA